MPAELKRHERVSLWGMQDAGRAGQGRRKEGAGLGFLYFVWKVRTRQSDDGEDTHTGNLADTREGRVPTYGMLFPSSRCYDAPHGAALLLQTTENKRQKKEGKCSLQRLCSGFGGAEKRLVGIMVEGASERKRRGSCHARRN